MSLRKALKPRGGLPQRRSGAEGDVPGAAQRDPQVGTSSIHWKAALNCFTLLWEDRIRAANGM